VCYDRIEFGETHDFKGENEDCSHYKSKSLFVELPCRCKDCKHSKQTYIEYDEVFECHADTHYTGIRLVEADDFCKYAELKEMG
jgi:hypothetical protein